MNICHVITRLIIGGAQENTVLTCRGLVELGHRVTLVAGPETGPEGSLWDGARAAGCEVVTLTSMRRAVHPWSDVRARRELLRLFRRLAPDVVHTHSSKAGILGRSAAAAARVPTVIHTIHGMSFNRTQRPWTRRFYRALERRAARHTTQFVTVADAMIDQAVAAGLASRERFVTIRSGMQTELFAPDPAQRERVRREWGAAGDDVVVGTISRLFENKGYEAILAAMPLAVAAQPKLRFVWIGDGPHRARYERGLAEHNLTDRVRLPGLVHPSKVPALINGFDLILHASAWEGLPRAVVQGMLMEVPAITFDNDGAPEAVVHGETGLVVPYGDINGLATAVAELAADPERRRGMGRAGRHRCLHVFDWRRMVTDLDELYRRCGGLA